MPKKTPAELLAELADVDDSALTPLDVPEWGGRRLWMRVIPAAEGVEMSDAMAALQKGDQRESIYILLFYGLCAETGERLFPTVEDARVFLSRRDPKVLRRIQGAIFELNGFPTPGDASGKA